jgi:nicotinamidase-related amidase
MVEETNRLARAFTEKGWPILAFLDTHEPGVPEPPYPPHCERGTGEELFVPVSAD